MLSRSTVGVGLLLAVHVALLAYTATATSPTTDEPAHLAAGLYTWKSGKCDAYFVNPPLLKTMAAIPALLMGAKEDWLRSAPPPMRTEWEVGNSFIAANGQDIFWLVTWARWTCIPWSVLGGIVCYVWANRLYGPPCGWISLTLWCFSPTILGNGALLSHDVAAASTGILAGFAFWNWLESPSWERVVLSGLTLGLSWLVKLTWVLLPGIWLAVWLLTRLQGGWQGRSLWRECGQLFASAVVGIVLLNVGYAFEGTLMRLGEYEFTCGLLSGKPPRSNNPIRGNRFHNTIAGSLPVPLPSSFVYGLDAQKQDFEEPHILYFAGERSTTGWRHFYLLAALLKESPGTILIGALTVACLLFRSDLRHSTFRSVAVWLPPLIVLGVVSSQTAWNYYRYVLPVIPYAFVFIGQSGQLFCKVHLVKWVVQVLLVSAVFSGLASVPCSLSYVNEFGRIVSPAHFWFADCNYDWGQDLFALQGWIRKHPETEQLRLGYFGAVSPSLLGIEFKEMPEELLNPSIRSQPYQIPSGWYAISVSHVHGVEGHIDTPSGLRTVFNSGLSVFEDETPIDKAGASILIYKIKER